MSEKSNQKSPKVDVCVDCPRGTLCTFLSNGLPPGCKHTVFGTCYKCGKTGSYGVRKILPAMIDTGTVFGHFLMPEHTGCEKPVPDNFRIICKECLYETLFPKKAS